MVYTLIEKPYKLVADTLRAVFNILVMIVITSMRVYLFYLEESQIRSWKSYAYPGLLEILFFIIILWAYVVVIKDIVDWYQIQKKQKKGLIFEMFDEI